MMGRSWIVWRWTRWPVIACLAGTVGVLLQGSASASSSAAVLEIENPNLAWFVTEITNDGENASNMRSGIDSARLSVGNGDGFVTSEEAIAFAAQFRNLANRQNASGTGSWANLTIDGHHASTYFLEGFTLAGAEGAITSQAPILVTFNVRMGFDEVIDEGPHAAHFGGSVITPANEQPKPPIFSLTIRVESPLTITSYDVDGLIHVNGPAEITVTGHPHFHNLSVGFAAGKGAVSSGGFFWTMLTVGALVGLLRISPKSAKRGANGPVPPKDMNP